MCTVVCRWHPEEPFPVQMLALRDELASRSYDLPGTWWPGQPTVLGGRDRTAGGTWCASDVATGVTAVVLNRPERRLAAPGAASRGVLPLRGVRHPERWMEDLPQGGMASFNLVVVSPRSLVWWRFDGERLAGEELGPGTHLFTPRGLAAAPLEDRWAAGRAHLDRDPAAPTEQVWPDWLDVVRGSEPSPDSVDLIVRRPAGEDSYETVFGQLIAARPGWLRLDYLPRPAQDLAGAWTAQRWRASEAGLELEES